MNNTKSRFTQKERKAESERRILHAAVELFAKQGYTKTTLSEVGKAAGYTGGLVSHRFGSKEQLLMAVLQNSAFRFMEDQLRPSIEGDHIQSAEKALRNYIKIYFDEVFLRESNIRALYVIMGEGLGAVPEVQPHIAAINKAMRKRIALIVRQGVESGEFGENVDSEDWALMIFGMLRGTVMQYLADPKSFEVTELTASLQNTVISGLKVSAQAAAE